MSIISNLLTTYSLVDVILILFLLAFGARELLQLSDFFKTRNRSRIDEEYKGEENSKQLLEKMGDLEDQLAVIYNDNTSALESIKATLNNHQETLEMLIQSDKDDIRADIVKQHHYFMNKGHIDDFSMDAIERRYDHYRQEGGNSYICDLVQDLRQLPKQ